MSFIVKSNNNNNNKKKTSLALPIIEGLSSVCIIDYEALVTSDTNSSSIPQASIKTSARTSLKKVFRHHGRVRILLN